MQQYTFKQLGATMFVNQPNLKWVTPPTPGIGSFVRLGARNSFVAVFIPSALLTDDTDFNRLFQLPAFPIDTHYAIIQYNSALGGYLYSWAKD